MLHRLAVDLPRTLSLAASRTCWRASWCTPPSAVRECTISSWDELGDRLTILPVYEEGVGIVESHRGELFPLTDWPQSRQLLQEAHRVPRVPPRRCRLEPGCDGAAGRAGLAKPGCRLPLVVENHSVGLIEVVDYAGTATAGLRATSPSRQTIADHAAMAVRSAQLYESLQRQVVHDPLTGLLNHRALHERVAAELAEAQLRGGDLSLIAIDLDDFSTVNDRDGHLAGDRPAATGGRHAARASAATAMPPGVSAATGSSWSLPGLGDEAAAVAERLVARIAHSAGTSASAGVARHAAGRARRGLADRPCRPRPGRGQAGGQGHLPAVGVALYPAPMWRACFAGADRRRRLRRRLGQRASVGASTVTSAPAAGHRPEDAGAGARPAGRRGRHSRQPRPRRRREDRPRALLAQRPAPAPAAARPARPRRTAASRACSRSHSRPGLRSRPSAYVDYTDLDGNTHVARLDTGSGSIRTILFVRQPYANHNGGGARVRAGRRAVRGHGRRWQRGRPAGKRPEPPLPARQDPAPGRSAAAAASRSCTRYGLRNPWRFSFDRATGDALDRRRRPEPVRGDRPAGRRHRRRAPTWAGTCTRRASATSGDVDRRPLVCAGRVLRTRRRRLLRHRRLRLPRPRGAGAARALRVRRLLLRRHLDDRRGRRPAAPAGPAGAARAVLVRDGSRMASCTPPRWTDAFSASSPLADLAAPVHRSGGAASRLRATTRERVTPSAACCSMPRCDRPASSRASAP